MFLHGPRVSEAYGLVLQHVVVESRMCPPLSLMSAGRLLCRRTRVLHDAQLKGGLSTSHPLPGDEIPATKARLVWRARLKAPGKDLGQTLALRAAAAPAPLDRQPGAAQGLGGGLTPRCIPSPRSEPYLRVCTHRSER
jgi:hypothetical protein